MTKVKFEKKTHTSNISITEKENISDETPSSHEISEYNDKNIYRISEIYKKHISRIYHEWNAS